MRKFTGNAVPQAVGALGAGEAGIDQLRTKPIDVERDLDQPTAGQSSLDNHLKLSQDYYKGLGQEDHVVGDLARGANVGSQQRFAGYLEELDANRAGYQDIQRSQQQGLAALNPNVDLGHGAGNELASMLGLQGADPFDSAALAATPGYQFRLNEGKRLQENSAIGTGLSGQTMRGLEEFAQGTAAGAFNDRVGQLNNLVGHGVNSANALAGTNQGYAGLYGVQSGSLQESAQRHSQDQAGLSTSLAGSLADLEIARLTAASNQQVARTNADASKDAAKYGLAGDFFNRVRK